MKISGDRIMKKSEIGFETGPEKGILTIMRQDHIEQIQDQGIAKAWF